MKEGALMRQHIGFVLNSGEYSIPILKVREIIHVPVITRMPSAPYYIEGVTNLRGAVIPVINLKKLLRMYDDGSPYTNVIVVAGGRVVFGMLVDGIAGVVNIEDSDIEHPEVYAHEDTAWIEGVAKLHDRLITLIDTARLFPSEDASLFENIVDVRETSEGGQVEVTRTVHTMAGEMHIRELCDAKRFIKDKGITENDPRFLLCEDIMNFLDAMSNNDTERAEAAIDQIMKKGQGDLFKEVGRVTRKMHDSIKSFKEALDPKIRDMAEHEMQGAIERLQFVIDKTEEAANKTMSIVEKHMLVMDELSSEIRNLKEPAGSIAYIKNYQNMLESDLTELITTQSFQDITGQTIKKVITLVGEIEAELVRLISTFGVKIEAGAKAQEQAAEKVSQADVDDMLKDFGF